MTVITIINEINTGSNLINGIWDKADLKKKPEGNLKIGFSASGIKNNNIKYIKQKMKVDITNIFFINHLFSSKSFNCFSFKNENESGTISNDNLVSKTFLAASPMFSE